MRIRLLLFSVLFTALIPGSAQTITGVWRGKIDRQQTELKLVKKGDEIVGVAYYYTNKNNYRRYSVRGRFDVETNAVIWWDEVLIDDQKPRYALQIGADPGARLMSADFNCPGGDEMYLDGASTPRDNNQATPNTLHLVKQRNPLFPDEWDYIIDNYFVGANNPDLIDSIARFGILAKMPEEPAVSNVPATAPSVPAATVTTPSAPGTTAKAPPVPSPGLTPPVASAVPAGNEQKFATRKNVLQTVIPVTAESIELRFYDNAQVDGDSIALFLNGKKIFEHIRLTEQPYTIHLQASDLAADNELVMVAENLGSIPPNTSFMVAIVGNKRYEARLFANEQSSALVRIVK